MEQEIKNSLCEFTNNLDKLFKSKGLSQIQKTTVSDLLKYFNELKTLSSISVVDMYEKMINIKQTYHDKIATAKLNDNEHWINYIEKIKILRCKLLSWIGTDELLKDEINAKNIVKSVYLNNMHVVPMILDNRSAEILVSQCKDDNIPVIVMDGHV